MLLPTESALIERYRNLPESARCLFVRLANRRRSVLRHSRLQYPEIPDLTLAIKTLETANLITTDPQHLCEDLLGWLREYTKPELMRLFTLDLKSGQLNKAECLDLILRCKEAEVIAQNLSAYDPALSLRAEPELQVIKFLFFGSLNRDMEQFVLRDLGQVVFEALDTKLVPAYFLNRQHLQDCLAMRLLHQEFRSQLEQLSPVGLAQWYEVQRQQHQNLHPDAARELARLSVQVGITLERSGLLEAALVCYGQSEQATARERRVRLLHRLQRSEDALAVCREIQAKPNNGGEQIFAEDFALAIQTGRTRRAVTRHLKTASKLVLPQTTQRVEEAVLAYFRTQGWQGLYAENLPWRSLLGLLLWDVLYDERGGGLINPLQRNPVDLWSPDFYHQRQAAIDLALERLNHRKGVWSWLEQQISAKWGIANPLVIWIPELPELLRQLSNYLQPSQLRAVLLKMLSNVRDQAHGFPDLLLWCDGQYRLLEVKSPTDRLSDQQLYWLRSFKQLGICADVVQVRWVAD